MVAVISRFFMANRLIGLIAGQVSLHPHVMLASLVRSEDSLMWPDQDVELHSWLEKNAKGVIFLRSSVVGHQRH
jgi:hypothetical protein